MMSSALAVSDFAGGSTRAVAGFRPLSLPAILSGALISIYFLDDSVVLKSQLFILLIVVLLVWLLASGFTWDTGSEAWRMVLWCFALSYSISVTVALTVSDAVAINSVYPFLFICFCLRRPRDIRLFFYGLFIGLTVLMLFGWYRFITVDGGVISEHLLGYWGIKYTEATRNSDAITPTIVTAISIACLHQKQQLWVKVLLWVVLLIGLPAVILTYSRSAWFALIAFIVIFNGLNWRVLVQMLAFAVIVGAALMILQDFAVMADENAALLERAMSIINPEIYSSNISRSKLLIYAFELGLCNPIIGVGPGQFGTYVSILGYPELTGALHPENLFMHLFSEYGIASALSLMAVLGIASREGLRSRTSDQVISGAAIGALILWLQMNSELSSLFIWVLLGVLASVAMNRPHGA